MTRKLSAEAAAQLGPGEDHYRAFVGPPKRYGLLALLQMNLLAALGLEETDTVLDFGCGSLRLGRVLIPFLRPNRYFGIDPYLWLVEDGFRHECGEDLRALKQPRFSDEANFDCTVFGERFDFIMAQSVITHAGAGNTRRLFETAAAALKEDGIMVLSYIKGADDAPLPATPWTYPQNVPYPEPWLAETARKAGLFWSPLNWHHPGASWAALARNPKRLPAPDAPLGLAGKPVDRL